LGSKRIRAAQAVAGGLTHAEAAALVGRSARTVTRWLQDPQLRALAERDGAAVKSSEVV
jgi:transposase